MKKKITKTLLTLCAAFIVLTGSASLASAAVVIPDSTNHTHHFNTLVRVGTRHEDAGTHQYVWGYDPSGNPIYHYDCRLTNVIWIRDYKCDTCDQLMGGELMESIVFIKHSINHD